MGDSLFRPAEPGTNTNAAWLPGGQSIVYASDASGKFDLFRTSLGAPGKPERIYSGPSAVFPLDVSPDGRFVLYRVTDAKTGTDIAALPLTGQGQPFDVVNSPFDDREGQFSPDGAWIVYQSNETGRFEIYVRKFLEPTRKWQVSVSGGVQPRWRRDGRELFFLSVDRREMFAASAHFGSGDQVDLGAPLGLFATRVIPTPNSGKHQYAVSPDGQRFLINTAIESVSAPITLLLNWKAHR